MRTGQNNPGDGWIVLVLLVLIIGGMGACRLWQYDGDWKCALGAECRRLK